MMGMSKTSMSTGMRTMTDLKMVHKVWEKGTRKDLYEVEMDWYQTFADFFSIKWRKSTEQNVNALSKSLKEFQQLKEDNHNNEALQQRIEPDIIKMKNALAYYRWLGRLIDSFESGDIFNYIPKEHIESDK
jgi:DNA-binding transcriptional regulator GbsR (MarR family)